MNNLQQLLVMQLLSSFASAGEVFCATSIPESDSCNAETGVAEATQWFNPWRTQFHTCPRIECMQVCPSKLVQCPPRHSYQDPYCPIGQTRRMQLEVLLWGCCGQEVDCVRSSSETILLESRPFWPPKILLQSSRTFSTQNPFRWSSYMRGHAACSTKSIFWPSLSPTLASTIFATLESFNWLGRDTQLNGIRP